MIDFTLKQYQILCEFLLNQSYTFLTVADYLSGNYLIEKRTDKIVIIRHDVDRMINNSLTMAEIEHNLHIFSTYYFRYPATFSPEILLKIKDFGHEIGYHYEVVSKTNGNLPLAWIIFQKELELFRSISPIYTISMHGSPISPYNNLDLWKVYSFLDIDLMGDASISVNNLLYLSDTGRRWDGRNNLRDHIPGCKGCTKSLQSTSDLISYIMECCPSILYLNIHPERWNDMPLKYCLVYILDISFSIGKKILHIIHRENNE